MKVQFYRSKKVSQDDIFLCNQYENQSAEIEVILSDEFISASYFYYIVCKSPDKLVNQFAIPLTLNDGILNYIVHSNITNTPGNWEFCIVVKNTEIVNGIIGADGLIAISKYFTGEVKKGILDDQQLSEQPLDENLQIVYDDLIATSSMLIAAENARKIFEAYNNSKAYTVGNKVSYNGSSYTCTVNCTGKLPTDGSCWLLIASKGEQGIQGERGLQGLVGETGQQGIQGNQGERGIQGETGLQGDIGPMGIQGETGAKGDKGDKGETGSRGVQGIAGPKGDTGDVGPIGDTGIQGIQGDKGDQGIQGIQGIKGDTGNPGIKGDTGPKGDKGDTGEGLDYNTMTPEEIASIKGDKGDKGEQGIQGEQGTQGTQGIQGTQGSQGIQGAEGPQGPKGDPSSVNNISAVSGNITLKAENIPFDETKTVKEQINDLGAYATASGTNTYTATIGGYTLVEGQTVRIKFTNANTGASTLNINGLGAKSIVKGNGSALSSGNIKAGQICNLVYGGVNFQLLGEGGEYGTAVANDVLVTKTIGTDGGLVTGTMPNNGSQTATITTQGGTKVIPAGNTTGGTVTASFANCTAGNIKKDVNVGGVVGSLEVAPVFTLADMKFSVSNDYLYDDNTDVDSFNVATKYTDSVLVQIENNYSVGVTMTISASKPIFYQTSGGSTLTGNNTVTLFDSRSIWLFNPTRALVALTSSTASTSIKICTLIN